MKKNQQPLAHFCEPIMEIFTTKDKKDERFLRRKTADFDFRQYTKKELRKLIQSMRETMKRAQGIGLSANQVGINANFFIAEVNNKCYSIFNPKIEKTSPETVELEEGCLSVPGVYGSVKRPEKIVLRGSDVNGKQIKIKAWGLLAKVFQHEVDHLSGKLFVDRAENIHAIDKSEAQSLES